MLLPPEVTRDLAALRADPEWLHPYRAYLGALIQAGWRVTTLARALGLSYQRVQQLALREPHAAQSVSEYRLILALPLPLPDAPRYAEKPANAEPDLSRRAPGYSGRGRPRLTHCKRGHALSGANLIVYGERRYCRACQALRQRRRYGRRAGVIYPNA